MTISHDDVARLNAGRTSVLGPDGDQIGHVSEVYTSDQTGEPVWATVKTGLFGTQETFVPLQGASLEGDELRVAFDKATVKDAPRVDAGGHLSVEEEDDLYRYYGVDAAPEAGIPPAGDRGLTDRDDDRAGLTDRDDVSDRDRDADRDQAGTALAGGGLGAAAGTAVADRDDDHDDRTAFGDRDDDRTDLGDRDDDRDDTTDRPQPFADRSAEQTGDRGTTAAAGAGLGAAAGTAAAASNRSDDDRLSSNTGPRRSLDDDRTTGSDQDAEDAVSPGERTTRLRRYVVTERVVQTIEELPDDDAR